MATPESYKLEIELPKRNVFVTQLNEREEEEYHEFPVVKETAGKLLEEGINTFQKTLLLKRELEVEKVDEELQRKREEFQARMEESSRRQVDIQKKQQKMKDRVTKFEKFINENEAKRRRAIQKYQNEVKLKEQKSSEYELLCEQLEELKKRHEYLKRKLAVYKKYEEYLLNVVEVLPAHYLEVQDSMVNSLMMRHKTLSATNQSLIENLEGMVDQLETAKGELEETNQEHDKKKLSINSQLSLMQKAQEHQVSSNQEEEQTFNMSRKELRAKRTEIAQIFMAIDNIAEKCKMRTDPPLDDLTREEKLDIIKKYLVDSSDVAKMVTYEMASSSPRSERSPGSKRRSPTRSNLKVGFTH